METKKRFILHLLVITISWGLILFGHYVLVPNAKLPILIAIFDPFIHGLTGLIVVVPFFWWRQIGWLEFSIAVLLALFIDLDHVLAAQSFKLEQLLSLPERPIGHSFLFCIVISVAAAIIVKYVISSKQSLLLLFYVFSAALLSHVARDAVNSTNTPWAFPFKSGPINELVFFAGFFILSFVHLYYAFNTHTRNTNKIEMLESKP